MFDVNKKMRGNHLFRRDCAVSERNALRTLTSLALRFILNVNIGTVIVTRTANVLVGNLGERGRSRNSNLKNLFAITEITFTINP